MLDLVIIGGGPGAVGAGVYAARKKIKTLLITDSFGGQSLVSSDVQNWIGDKSITGLELASKLEDHLRAQEDIEISDNDRVNLVEKIPIGFKVGTQNDKFYETKTLLIASGSRRKRLGVSGEDKLDGKGVAYCSTCDAPLFKNKIVAVVGGGNAGLESALDLASYANKIYMLIRGSELRGDPISQEKVSANSKVEIIFNVIVEEILGDNFVSGLKYKDSISSVIKNLSLEGVFVEIGSMPNRDFLKNLVELNKAGEITIDPRTQSSSVSGIWAVGDVSDVKYKQNNIAVGDGVKAILNIYEFLNKN
jgi:alkyl hydroperoxide reductase subunit F